MIWPFQGVLRPLRSQLQIYEKSQKMTQRERIAWYVLRGELIESESLYAAFRALGGNRNVRGRAAKAEWVVVPHTLFC